MTPPLLLALDPSLRCTGGVLVTLDGNAELFAAFAIETFAARTLERAIHKQHDAGRCGVELFAGLVARCEEFAPACVALEIPIGAQSADAAWAMGRANQAARCALHAALPHLAPMSVAATEAKLSATGSKRPKDAKGDVRRGVTRRWGPSRWAEVLVDLPTNKQREAAYDAAAVALVALRQPAARLVIRDYVRATGAAQDRGKSR